MQPRGTEDRAAGGALETVRKRAQPERTPAERQLKDLVTEATRALARLDVERLRELALSCEALIGMPQATTKQERVERARQARAARSDMAVFARALEATGANAKVMERLRELREGKTEYVQCAAGMRNWSLKGAEGRHGND
jgi:hypothetical protein